MFDLAKGLFAVRTWASRLLFIFDTGERRAFFHRTDVSENLCNNYQISHKF